MNIPISMPANLGANANVNTTATGATSTAGAGATESASISDVFAALLGGLATSVGSEAGVSGLASDGEQVDNAATDAAPHDGSDASETVLAMSQFAAMFNPQIATPNLPHEAPAAEAISQAAGETPLLTESTTSSTAAAPLAVTEEVNPLPASATTAAQPGVATTAAPSDAAGDTAPTNPRITQPSGQGSSATAPLTRSTDAAAPTALSDRPEIQALKATATQTAAATPTAAGAAQATITGVAAIAVAAPTEIEASAPAVGNVELPKPASRVKLKAIDAETDAATRPAINPDEQLVVAAAQAGLPTKPNAVSTTSNSSEDSTSISATTANAHSATVPTRQPIAAAGPQATAPSTPLAPATQQVLDAIEPMAQRADGTYHLKLSLNPHNLGRVELSIELHDGVLAVHMAAERPETQRVLTEQLTKLREILDERGVSMGSLDVGDHSSRNAFSAQGQAQAQERNSSSRRNSSTAIPGEPTIAATPERSPISRPSPSTNLLDVHA